MRRQSVDSSVLAAVAYDEPTRTLVVEFNSGRIYAYLRVPRSVCEALLAAESVGGYFNREVRSKYTYREIG